MMTEPTPPTDLREQVIKALHPLDQWRSTDRAADAVLVVLESRPAWVDHISERVAAAATVARELERRELRERVEALRDLPGAIGSNWEMVDHVLALLEDQP